MNILIVSEPSSKYVTSRLKEEAEKMGHSVDIFYYSDMVIKLGDKPNVYFKDELLKKYDTAILRMVMGKSMIFYKDVLVRALHEQGTFVVNGNSYIKWVYFGKLTQNYILAQNNLPVVQASLFAGPHLVNEETVKFPAILKKNLSRLGTGVTKVHHFDEFKEYHNEGISELLVQKFLPTGTDFRVFVVGDEVLPKVMRKTAPEGSFITNFSQGGTVTPETLNDEMKYLALATAKLFDLDYGGVDIMYDELGKPFILEVNRSAHFEGFEQATGINVAQKTIELLEKKHKKHD
jgi:ribosomal protein S6--L-glutamate ligase